MPTISYFYGIIIVMYLRNKEHNPPHIHAITQDFDAPFLIATGELMEGEFPPKAQALVKEFVMKYQKELLEMWEKGRLKDSDIRKALYPIANKTKGAPAPEENREG